MSLVQQNNTLHLTEEVKQSLDQSLQLKKVETVLYALTQIFSLVSSLVISQTIGNVESYIQTSLPFYLLVGVSILTGQLAYILARRYMQMTQKTIAQVGDVPEYFFNRYTPILIIIRAGFYTVFFNLFIYGAIAAVTAGN